MTLYEMRVHAAALNVMDNLTGKDGVVGVRLETFLQQHDDLRNWMSRQGWIVRYERTWPGQILFKDGFPTNMIRTYLAFQVGLEETEAKLAELVALEQLAR